MKSDDLEERDEEPDDEDSDEEVSSAMMPKRISRALRTERWKGVSFFLRSLVEVSKRSASSSSMSATMSSSLSSGSGTGARREGVLRGGLIGTGVSLSLSDSTMMHFVVFIRFVAGTVGGVGLLLDDEGDDGDDEVCFLLGVTAD